MDLLQEAPCADAFQTPTLRNEEAMRLYRRSIHQAIYEHLPEQDIWCFPAEASHAHQIAFYQSEGVLSGNPRTRRHKPTPLFASAASYTVLPPISGWLHLLCRTPWCL